MSNIAVFGYLPLKNPFTLSKILDSGAGGNVIGVFATDCAWGAGATVGMGADDTSGLGAGVGSNAGGDSGAGVGTVVGLGSGVGLIGLTSVAFGGSGVGEGSNANADISSGIGPGVDASGITVGVACSTVGSAMTKDYIFI